MARTGLAVIVVTLLMVAVFAVPTFNNPDGVVEVKQLAESSEQSGSVEVKELPPPVEHAAKGSVDVKQLPAPPANAWPASRKS